MKKKVLAIAVVLLAVIVCVLGGIKLYRVKLARQSGIVLAFDDYNEQSWEACFDLFDKYDAKVTFFVNAWEPTDFCYKAIERGHEIAYHTANHSNLREITEEEMYEVAIAPIEVFREKGIELTSFAYPYGAYNEELNQKLLQYYKVLRGAYYYQLVGKDKMRNGFVESMSIDNVNYETKEAYEERIDAILEELCNNPGAVAGVYSHAIGAGDWSVSEENLEYLLQKASSLGLRFYTFKYLQEH